jgi:hypothetical protein
MATAGLASSRAIARARAQRTAGIAELAREREQVMEEIHQVVSRMEIAV